VALIPPQPVGTLPGSTYWNDWIEKLRTLINGIATNGLSHLILSNVQGGNATEQYHLSAAEHTALIAGYTGTGLLVRQTSPTIITPTINGATTLLKTSTALANGAAAAAGTLLNAPAAGNPTKWAPVDDNGTTRYVPMW
jgi:hypothetical protein